MKHKDGFSALHLPAKIGIISFKTKYYAYDFTPDSPWFN